MLPSRQGVRKKDKKVQAPSEAQDATESSASAQCLTVFVGGVPWECGEDVLRKDFGECGEVTSVKVLTHADSGLSKGVAFITFKDEAGVEAALAYDGTEYGGRTLKVNKAPDRNAKGQGKGKGRPAEVFVKGMDRMSTEQKLRTFFKDCGDIVKIGMPLAPEGHCKGFAWITFDSQESADKAVEKNGTQFNGKEIFVEVAGLHLSGDGKGKSKGKTKGDPELEVFVRNMPFEIDEPTLRRDFAECGEIVRLNLPMKGEDKCCGFAWITFKTKEAVDKALAFDGDDYGGRKLMVEKSGQHKGKGKGK